MVGALGILDVVPHVAEDTACVLVNKAGSAYRSAFAHRYCACSVYLSILKYCSIVSTYVIQKKPKMKADIIIKIKLLVCTSML